MTDVFLTATDDSDYRGVGNVLRSAYDPEVVSTIKDRVPSSGRSYDPQTKTWFVGSGYEDPLIETLTAMGHRIFRDGDQPPAVAPQPKRSEPGVAQFFGIDDDDGFDAAASAAAFIDSIEPHRRHKVFRAMAKLLYPDLYAGGRR